MHASCYFMIVTVSLVGESLCIPILGGLTETPGVAPIGTNSHALSGPMQAAPSVADSLASTLHSVVGTLLGKRDTNVSSGLPNPSQGLSGSSYPIIPQAGSKALVDLASSSPAVGTLPKVELGSLSSLPTLPQAATSALGPASSLPLVGSLPQAGTSALGSTSTLPVVGTSPQAATTALGSASSMSAEGTLARASTSALHPVTSLPVVGILPAASTAAIGQASLLPAAGSSSQGGFSTLDHASSSPTTGTTSKAPLVGKILPGLTSLPPLGPAPCSSTSSGDLVGGLL